MAASAAISTAEPDPLGPVVLVGQARSGSSLATLLVNRAGGFAINDAYAAQAAWMEDHRRLSNGALCHRALGLALAHPVSRVWKGYWQRAILKQS